MDAQGLKREDVPLLGLGIRRAAVSSIERAPCSGSNDTVMRHLRPARRYGNMSSATILFVLEENAARGITGSRRVGAS